MIDVVIRKATLADREAVLAINDNVFGGRDYLPALYDSIITAPNNHMFVLLLRDKIVAFSGQTVVDGGRTGVGRSGRSLPALAGQGLGFKLVYYCVDWVQTQGAVLSCGTELLHQDNVRQRHGNYSKVLSKTLLPYLVDVSQLRKETFRASVSEISITTEKDLTSYFECYESVSYLFPSGRILVNAVPYRMMGSNVRLIMENAGKFTEMYTNVAKRNQTYTGLLSVGTVYPVKIPNYAYNIELYGEDFSSLEEHICRHLKRITDRTYGIVSIYVFVDPDKRLLPQLISEIMGKYGVTKCKPTLSKTGEELTTERVVFEDFIPLISRY